MAHKVHPKIYRIKSINDWSSRGFYRNPREWLEEDFKIREFLKKKIGKAGLEKIEIERFPEKINIIIFSSRPGLIIGRGGQELEKLKKMLLNKVLKKDFSKKEKVKSLSKQKKPKEGREVRIEIREVKNPWTSASLIAQWVAQQIERRIPYRRVLKQALSKISANKEIKGARIEVAGRLDGAEIARREWLKFGSLPLQTIRADVDYAREEAYCTYGVIGIKVWLYKGEKI